MLRGGTATIAPMDLTDSDNIKKLAQAVAERWGSLDILVLNAAMLGAFAGRASRPEGTGTRLQAQRLRQPGLDRGLRSTASPRGQGRHHRHHVLSRRGAARFLGRLWRVQGGFRHDAWCLCRRDRPRRQASGPDRRSRRDPHPHAAAGIPGEEPESVKAPEAVASAILERLQGEAETGSRASID